MYLNKQEPCIKSTNLTTALCSLLASSALLLSASAADLAFAQVNRSSPEGRFGHGEKDQSPSFHRPYPQSRLEPESSM